MENIYFPKLNEKAEYKTVYTVSFNYIKTNQPKHAIERLK